MRKQTKIAALVSAAALLAIGASMTSFAYGWNFDGMDWEWLDRDKNRVTDTWKTSGGKYYWLDENGIMATDQLIEDDGNWYYVDENGVRVTNQWKDFESDDVTLANGDEVDVVWYYFGDNGRAYKATEGNLKVRTVSWNGTSDKFIFDAEGVMQSGWVEMDNGDVYWCGDETDGHVHTGWMYLEPSEVIMDNSAYEDQEWFNFKSNGKMRKSSNPGTIKTEYFSGRYWSFNCDGVLQDDWFDVTTDAGGVATANGLYADVDGAKTGWVYTNEYQKDDDYAWYYLIKANGYKTAPFNLDNASNAYAARVINGKTYMFAKGGKMLTGIIKVMPLDAETYDEGVPDGYHWIATPGQAKTNPYLTGTKAMKSGIYYFSEAAASQGKDGRMMTGKTAVTDDDDTNYYYFSKEGYAYTSTIKDNVLYDHEGKRVQTEEGNAYQVINISDLVEESGGVPISIGNGEYSAGSVIVTSSGKVKRNTKVNIDGVKYTVKEFFVDDAWSTDGATQYTADGVLWEEAEQAGE